jgi:hypothetical protein
MLTKKTKQRTLASGAIAIAMVVYLGVSGHCFEHFMSGGV